ARQRQWRVGAAAEGRGVVAVTEQLRLHRVAQVVDGEAAVTPGGIAEIAGADEVMQRGALAEGGRLLLAGGPVHAGQPPAAGKRGLGWIAHVDDGQRVV